MSAREHDAADHEDILALLPWYANRTLAPDEEVKVSHHLERCQDCREELRLLDALTGTVRADADDRHRTEADTDTALASVMARIDAEAGPAPTAMTTPWRTRFMDALERLLPSSLATPTARWGATALAGLLVAALGLQTYLGEARDDYSVLSSPGLDDAPIRLSVGIASAADREDALSVVESALERLALGADIDADADGAYVVAFEDHVGVDALNALIVELEGEPRIERVELLP